MSDTNDNKLAVKGAFKMKPVGLAARKAAVAAASPVVTIPEITVEQATHKTGIVFDDSSSMYSPKINDAQDGVVEYLKNCNPTNTAVAIYPMNAYNKRVKLSTKLIQIAKDVKDIWASGSTPLFGTTLEMLEDNALTRGIIFSDGEPDYYDTSSKKEAVIALALEKHIPLDTVFIGHKDSVHAVSLMQEIAEKTGGVFLIFEPGKVNFKTAFKYLSPGYRAMLMDKSFVEKLQEGKI